MWCGRMDRRARVFAIVLAAAALALWSHTYIRVRTVTDAYTGVSARIADTKIPGKRLARLLAEGDDSGLCCLAAWSRGDKITAEAASMETDARLRVVTVYGDIRQVTPMRLVCGGFLAEDDMDGCLLDTKSAQTLFHSVDVQGTAVTLGEKRYTVRGVVDGGEPMAIVRNADAAYDNLEFAAADLQAGKAAVDAFLYRNALSGDYTVVQNGLYARILHGLIWLPAALALLLAARRLACAALRRPRRAGRTAALLIAAAACGAAMVALFSKTFFWPQAFLPTKCADFAFWGALLNGWRETWERMLLMTPLPKDVLFFRDMRACICGIAAIMMLEAAACGCIRKRDAAITK